MTDFIQHGLFIHSFIADIYIAPLQVGYSEALYEMAQQENMPLKDRCEREAHNIGPIWLISSLCVIVFWQIYHHATNSCFNLTLAITPCPGFPISAKNFTEYVNGLIDDSFFLSLK